MLTQHVASEINLASIIEAILFTGGPALSSAQIKEHIDGFDEDRVIEAVAQLNQHYYHQGRPYEIRRVVSGYQMILRPQFSSIIRRLHGRSREVRLSVAAIEVLSLVAYRQPITLQTIDSIRGVDSASIVRQLRRRNLIEASQPVEGEPHTPGAPGLRTTKRFLELFRITNLEDLPRVQDLEKA